MMEKYGKNLIEEDFYLQRMGAMSLKLARLAHKTTTNVDGQEGVQEAAATAATDDESNDSLSETRPMPQSDDDTESFSDNDHHYGTDALTGGANRLLNRQIGKKKTKPNCKFISFYNVMYSLFLFSC